MNPPKPDFYDYEAVTAWRRTQSEPLALACPYCGETLTISATPYDPVHGEINVECDNTRCGAQWGSSRCTRTPAQFQLAVDRLAKRW